MTIQDTRPTQLAPEKFQDPDRTAKGEVRASVPLEKLETVWFNTGSLCNLTCENCYIESSPKNDRLAYLSIIEVTEYLDEIRDADLPVAEIGFTGGEPFLNPDFPAMLRLCLDRGFRVLVLTNAMKPLMNHRDRIAPLAKDFGDRLVFRVSIDHYNEASHEALRGALSFGRMLEGLDWLVATGFRVTVAGRSCWQESEQTLRDGYAALFAGRGVPVNAFDSAQLIIFPEMDEHLDVPEITTACWGILGISPQAMMCASSRMVIKRKGADHPVVVPCTLLPYDTAFETGRSLQGSDRPIKLNHPHCARFCVLGGASCSG